MFRCNCKIKRKPVDVNIQLVNKDHSHIVKSDFDGEIKLRAYYFKTQDKFVHSQRGKHLS